MAAVQPKPKDLEKAIKTNNINNVKTLLENFSMNVNLIFENGETPLHLAVVYGNIEIVKLLLEKGANINSLDKSNQTPLHLAVIYGNIEIINLLVEKGANINSLDKSNQTPLFKIFIDNFEKPTKTDDSKLKIVQILLDHGAHPNSKTHAGEAFSWLVVQNKDYRILAELLKYNINRKITDHLGKNKVTPEIQSIFDAFDNIYKPCLEEATSAAREKAIEVQENEMAKQQKKEKEKAESAAASASSNNYSYWKGGGRRQNKKSRKHKLKSKKHTTRKH